MHNINIIIQLSIKQTKKTTILPTANNHYR